MSDEKPYNLRKRKEINYTISDDSDDSDRDYVLELNTYDGSKLPDSDNRITLFVV